MIVSGILLALALAIIARAVVLGPRSYRLLAEADEAGRRHIYRRSLLGQVILYIVPSIAALLTLGRIDALAGLPIEFWTASSIVRGGYPAMQPDALLVWGSVGFMLFAIALGSAMTWRRTRQGKGMPRSIAHLAALLPRNRAEVKLGIAISFIAGIGEELFFRLLLPLLLATFIDESLAVVVAILLFGIGHWYQGWKGVLMTSAVGALLMMMYLYTGSLLVPIAYHTTLDLLTLAIRPAIRGAWARTA